MERFICASLSPPCVFEMSLTVMRLHHLCKTWSQSLQHTYLFSKPYPSEVEQVEQTNAEQVEHSDSDVRFKIN